MQRTGGEPLAWALESLKAERPLPVQGPLEGLLPLWPHPVFQLEDQCWVQGASHQMWGGRVAGQGPKTSVKWSCFRNRSPFTPSPVILFSLLCQRRQPWGKEPAGPPARPPLVPVGLCMGPAGQSSPCTHILFAGAFPEVIITWEPPFISPGLSQQGTNRGNRKTGFV